MTGESLSLRNCIIKVKNYKEEDDEEEHILVHLEFSSFLHLLAGNKTRVSIVQYITREGVRWDFPFYNHFQIPERFSEPISYDSKV